MKNSLLTNLFIFVLFVRSFVCYYYHHRRRRCHNDNKNKNINEKPTSSRSENAYALERTADEQPENIVPPVSSIGLEEA